MVCKKCNIEKPDGDFRLSKQRLRSGEYKLYKRLICRDCENTIGCKLSKEKKRWLTSEYKTKTNEYLKRRFFYTRAIRTIKTAKKLSIDCPYSNKELTLGLAQKWKLQIGFCALSGIKLTRDNAELDHIIPLSRGGQATLDNLRWVTKDVNRMKQNLLDEELFELILRVVKCTKVASKYTYRK